MRVVGVRLLRWPVLLAIVPGRPGVMGVGAGPASVRIRAAGAGFATVRRAGRPIGFPSVEVAATGGPAVRRRAAGHSRWITSGAPSPLTLIVMYWLESTTCAVRWGSPVALGRYALVVGAVRGDRG